jgi:protein-tyrosine phosphatase
MYIDYRKGQFYETLATLATPGVLPALFHCNGGKDRTGLIAALVLGLARVPNETIAEDYAVTGKYLLSRHITSQAKIGNDVSKMTWQEYRDLACPSIIMEETLHYIEQRYGGVEQYAVEIGLSSEQIASIREVIVD